MVHLATAPAGELVNGAYYDERKVAQPKAYLREPAIAAQLWERSLELTGLA
jgi:daunorubicin C-13 ketoreductase